MWKLQRYLAQSYKSFQSASSRAAKLLIALKTLLWGRNKSVVSGERSENNERVFTLTVDWMKTGNSSTSPFACKYQSHGASTEVFWELGSIRREKQWVWRVQGVKLTYVREWVMASGMWSVSRETFSAKIQRNARLSCAVLTYFIVLSLFFRHLYCV